MSTAGIAAPEMRVPLKSSFLHKGQGIGSLKPCWGGHFENPFFNMEPVAMAYNLNSSAQHHLTSIGHISDPNPAQNGGSDKPSPNGERPEDRGLVPAFGRLSLAASNEVAPPTPTKGGPSFSFPLAPPGAERSTRPLPPLPIPEDFVHDDVDREVEFLTSSDTDFLLEECSGPAFKPATYGRRSFRGCGQINYAYFDAPAGSKAEEPPSAKPSGCPAGVCAAVAAAAVPPPPPAPTAHQLHRRLRRSHSGPAGSFHKPVVRVSSHFRRASPSSDDDKPEVPPRVPIPPRVLKPDYRRWSAEVASGAYSDEDKPPKVPPREPLSCSNSRTPSPKSLPSYLNGIMPPTQSFAPDPKYVSSKALQRQHSEGSGSRVPCILPIIENGKKVSSTHYYLLPERPPYLDRYEKFFREAEEGSSLSAEGQLPPSLWPEAPEGEAASLAGMLNVPVKRKHLPCMVSP
ncbi:ERBB receptor feedback inhibitor 1 [Podarcis raffonei]|uniref:ERBB receptor feedback inhibitor 1 n=1 Tax=Podarcis raffonei TaxID=65483 RepID=UPI0023290DCA|nr:ERBB receptor feedback inhibitor 1 [Podarcis raffonei]